MMSVLPREHVERSSSSNLRTIVQTVLSPEKLEAQTAYKSKVWLLVTVHD